MDGIVAIWVVALVIAVVLTVPALGILVRFVHHARDVDRLARVTLAGAAGIAGNTANIPLLDTLLAHATSLAMTCESIDRVASKIHAHGAAVVRTLSAGGR